MNEPIVDTERRGWTSASNAEADTRCPGRHLAQKAVPVQEADEKPNPDAEKGKRIHEALAKRDPTGLAADESATYLQCCHLENGLLRQWFGADWESVQTVREQRFWVTVTTPNGDGETYRHSGMPDVVHRLKGKALIIEYKALYGRDIPVSSRNLQLRDQQVLVRGNLIIPGDIAVAVIQPKLSLEPSLCVYDIESYEVARRELFFRVIESNTEGSPRRAGEVQCNHCRAKRWCHEYQQWAGTSVPMPRMDSILGVPVAEWTKEQRAVFWKGHSIAQKWLDDCKAAMKEGFATDPEFIPGHELAPGKTRRVVTDPQKVFERFVNLGGTVEGFMGTINVGITKLKESLMAVTKLRGKALDAKQAELLKDCIAESTDAPSIRVRKGGK